jgi:hypothetical protein
MSLSSTTSTTIHSFQTFRSPNKDESFRISEAIQKQDRSITDAINRISKEKIKPNSFIYRAMLGKRWDKKLSCEMWNSIPDEAMSSH